MGAGRRGITGGGQLLAPIEALLDGTSSRCVTALLPTVPVDGGPSSGEGEAGAGWPMHAIWAWREGGAGESASSWSAWVCLSWGLPWLPGRAAAHCGLPLPEGDIFWLTFG